MNTARIAPHVSRVLLGLVFLVFGLNGFLKFLPMPPQPEEAGKLLGAFAGSGYFFPLLKATEVLAGVALLSNRFVPLALVVLAPIVVNILAFHLALSPDAMSPVLTLLLAFTAWGYRDHFRSVLAVRAQPSAAATSPVSSSALADAE